MGLASCLILVFFFGMQWNVQGRSLEKDERDLLISMLEEKLLDKVRKNAVDAQGEDICQGDICIITGGAMQKECLDAHNKVRAYHDAGPLEWSETPADESTPSDWAKKLASTGMFMHDMSTKWGENIAMYGFMGDKPELPCAEAVFMWYGEVKDYTGEFSYGITGHFTQLVWKATTKVNCGVAYSKSAYNKAWYTVCRYSVAGNRGGEFDANVSAKDKNLFYQLKSGHDLVEA